MKKNLTALFVTIIMMVTGACLSYAAFPVASHNTAATTTASNTAPTVTMQDESVANTTLTMHNAVKPGGGKSQIVALILCIVVGGLGIHRFYLGYTWQGIVQLLTAGGCGIWALIDLIRICTGDLQPKGGKYAKTF